MPVESGKQHPQLLDGSRERRISTENEQNVKRPSPSGVERSRELFWGLRRKVADIVTEFEFTTREAQQLSQKRVTCPPLETIQLTDEERRILQNNHQKRLQEIVQKHCTTIIKNLTVYKWSYPFNQPVDINVYKDYKSFVRKPMDLGTIKQKMSTYRNPHQFEDDVRLVFSNARSYNPEGTDVRRMADAVEEKFSEKWVRNILPKLNEEQRICMEEERSLRQSKAALLVMKTEGDIDHICGQLLERLEKLLEQIHYTQCLAAGICGYVTGEERVRLGWEMTTLAPEHFQRAANLVLTRHPGLMAAMKDNTIQLDLEKMDALTLRQLQDFVRQCRRNRHKIVLSGGDSLETRGRACKKQRTSANPTGLNTPDALHASRSAVQWPHIPYGIGLKPYKPENEPVTPQVPPQPPPRQLSSRMSSDSLKMSQLGQGGFVRTATAPTGTPRVSLRPSRGPAGPPQVALPRRSAVHTNPSTPANIVDRALLRTQGSAPVPNTIPWAVPGFGTAVATPKASPQLNSSTPFVEGGMSQISQVLASRDGSEKITTDGTGALRATAVQLPTSLPSVSGMPASFLTTGILPFSQQIPTSVLSQTTIQGSVGISTVSSPFVIPLVSSGTVASVQPTSAGPDVADPASTGQGIGTQIQQANSGGNADAEATVSKSSAKLAP